MQILSCYRQPHRAGGSLWVMSRQSCCALTDKPPTFLPTRAFQVTAIKKMRHFSAIHTACNGTLRGESSLREIASAMKRISAPDVTRNSESNWHGSKGSSLASFCPARIYVRVDVQSAAMPLFCVHCYLELVGVRHSSISSPEVPKGSASPLGFGIRKEQILEAGSKRTKGLEDWLSVKFNGREQMQTVNWIYKHMVQMTFSVGLGNFVLRKLLDSWCACLGGLPADCFPRRPWRYTSIPQFSWWQPSVSSGSLMKCWWISLPLIMWPRKKRGLRRGLS